MKQQQVEAPAMIMIELLRTYEGADADRALEDARECVRSAIADPATFLFDHLLQLRPVQLLQSGDALIYRLLQIFVSGTLKDYLGFCEENPDYIGTRLGLQEHVLIQKMRILTVMSIGEIKQEVDFQELAETLQLEQGEELEQFVIKAVLSNAIKVCPFFSFAVRQLGKGCLKLQAKIDQVRHKLLINMVQHRRFEKPQWELLRCRLDAWSSNLQETKRHLDVVAAKH